MVSIRVTAREHDTPRLHTVPKPYVNTPGMASRAREASLASWMTAASRSVHGGRGAWHRQGCWAHLSSSAQLIDREPALAAFFRAFTRMRRRRPDPLYGRDSRRGEERSNVGRRPLATAVAISIPRERSSFSRRKRILAVNAHSLPTIPRPPICARQALTFRRVFIPSSATRAMVPVP